jgi:hypothetical protein
MELFTGVPYDLGDIHNEFGVLLERTYFRNLTSVFFASDPAAVNELLTKVVEIIFLLLDKINRRDNTCLNVKLSLK